MTATRPADAASVGGGLALRAHPDDPQDRTEAVGGASPAGPEIVGFRLTQAAYAHRLALAVPAKVALARPTGVGRGITAVEIPIAG